VWGLGVGGGGGRGGGGGGWRHWEGNGRRDGVPARGAEVVGRGGAGLPTTGAVAHGGCSVLYVSQFLVGDENNEVLFLKREVADGGEQDGPREQK